MFFTFLLCAFFVYSQATVNIIHTNYGLIEGQTLTNKVSGKKYYSFEGIPYAQPPLGQLRFQPPQKPIPWTEVRPTKQKGPKCFQLREGNEDCLYLNVFTPKLPKVNETKLLLPVMFYIHGGAFNRGSSSNCNPDYLIDKDIVLVTFNYRLNVFGFLNARMKLAQGNAGLKDQVAALQWVHENIEKFNGDPNNVTIFGHSAGGASVNYMMLSKLSKGLFHRAIMQSGSVLNEFALYSDPTSLVYKVGKEACDSNNIAEIVQCLQKLDAQKLYIVSNNPEIMGVFPFLVPTVKWAPTIENDVPGAFITENSFSLILNNKIANRVPTIIGYTNGEAGFFLKDIKSKKIDIHYYNLYPEYLLPASLNINTNDSNKIYLASNEILQHFFQNDSKIITNRNFIKYQSQNIFARSIRKFVEIMRPHMDIYFYKFIHKSQDISKEFDGVPHGDELKYIFYKYDNKTVSSKDNVVVKNMVTLWTNFAKFGNPTPNNSLNFVWPKVSDGDYDSDTTYLSICKKITVKINPDQDSYMFWEKLFKTDGNPPFSLW